MMSHTFNRVNTIGIIISVLIMIFAQNHSYPILFIGLFLAIMNLNRPLVIFPTMFITSLNTNYFVITPGLSCGLVFSVIMVLSLLFSLKVTEARFDSKNLIWILFLILFNLIMSLFSITGSMETFIIMAENLIMLYLLSIQKKFDIENLILCLSGAVAICIWIMLWAYLSGKMVETYDGRLTIEGVNENGLAMIYCQCSVVLIFASFFINNKVQKIVCLISFFITLYLLFLSGSRSALFGSIAGGVSVLICQQLSANKRIKSIIPIIIIILIAYIVFNYIMNLDLQVAERFKMDNIVEGRGTNRIDRRNFLLANVFPEHPFFGIGLGGVNEYAIGPGPCHNIIIDPIIQIGLVGFILYWIFLGHLLFRNRKLVKYNREIILPVSLFIACFINGMGEVVFFEKYFWNSVAMCVMFSNVLTFEKTNKI